MMLAAVMQQQQQQQLPVPHTKLGEQAQALLLALCTQTHPWQDK
jgi:hypothetical protein